MPDNLFQFVDSNPNSVIAPMPNMLPVFAQQVQQQNQDYDTGQQEYNAYQANIDKSRPTDNTPGSNAIYNKLKGVWANANDAINNVATGNMDYGRFRYGIDRFTKDIYKYSSALQNNNAAIAQAQKTAYDLKNPNKLAETEFEQNLIKYNSGQGPSFDPITGTTTGQFDSTIRTKPVIDFKDWVDKHVTGLSIQSLANMFYAPGTYNTAHPIPLTQDPNGNLVDPTTGKIYHDYDTVKQGGPNIDNMISSTSTVTNADGSRVYKIVDKYGNKFISTGKSGSYIINSLIARYSASPDVQEDANYLTKIGVYGDKNDFLKASLLSGTSQAYSDVLITNRVNNDMTGKGGSGSDKTSLPTEVPYFSGGINGNVQTNDLGTNNYKELSNNGIKSLQYLNNYLVHDNKNKIEFKDGDIQFNDPYLKINDEGIITYTGDNQSIKQSLPILQQNYNQYRQAYREINNNGILYKSLISNALNAAIPSSDATDKDKEVILKKLLDYFELNREQITLGNFLDYSGNLAKLLPEDARQKFEDVLKETAKNQAVTSNEEYIPLNVNTPSGKNLNWMISTILSQGSQSANMQIASPGDTDYHPISKNEFSKLQNAISKNNYKISMSADGSIIVSGGGISSNGDDNTFSYQLKPGAISTNVFGNRLENVQKQDPNLYNQLQTSNFIYDGFKSGILSRGKETVYKIGDGKYTFYLSLTPRIAQDKNSDLTFDYTIKDQNGDIVKVKDKNGENETNANESNVTKDKLLQVISSFEEDNQYGYQRLIPVPERFDEIHNYILGRIIDKNKQKNEEEKVVSPAAY